jgi:hypothetical protein
LPTETLWLILENLVLIGGVMATKQDMYEIGPSMKNVKLITVVFLVFIYTLGCKDVLEQSYALKVVNNSETSIGLYFDVFFAGDPVFPDTSLPGANQYVFDDIESGNLYIYDISRPFEDIYKIRGVDTISMFFFDNDTLAKYDWSEIRSGYRILKRYDLSLQDLENRNFIIEYPLNPNLGPIEQWP